MRVVLVSMPWLAFDRPSIAIGTLCSYVKMHEPEIEISCRSEHVQLWRMLQEDYEIMSRQGIVPELIYVKHLHPDRDRQVREAIEHYTRALKRDPSVNPVMIRAVVDACTNTDRILSVTDQHLETAAESLADEADVVGLSTVYSQLFASLALAKRIKEKNPNVRTVFGGNASCTAGASLVAQYDFVDYVVKGEGELRLLELLRHLRSGKQVAFPESTGILSRQHEGLQMVAEQDAAVCEALRLGEITDLDELPAPDYSDYYALSEEYSILLPMLPIEGSRGCWWKQKGKGRGSLRGCYFCGLNSQSTRREKSIERIAAELKEQAVKYESVHFVFTDNLVRTSGRKKLARALWDTGLDLRFNLEVRADLKSSELAAMKKVGCTGVLIGVEGLSTSYLKRMNKGTTTIHNLSIMRGCYEMDIPSHSNLVVHFPQTTGEEVAEMVRNISYYAICYEPLSASRFTLDYNSPVYEEMESFGLASASMATYMAQALPEDAAQRLRLPWLEHTLKEEYRIDWSPLYEALGRWAELHRSIRETDGLGVPKPLFYLDGGEFIQVVDRRSGYNTMVLSSQLREVYLYCMEIRTLNQISKLFDDQVAKEELMEYYLGPLLEQALMYREGNRFLSLAVAWNPEVAMRRIQTYGG